MKPAGRLDTIMDLRKVKEWWFNLPLLVFQLAFMIVGKIYGKVEVKWGQIWQAAKVSHVRLCLKKIPAWWEKHEFHVGTLHNTRYEYINFGYPKAEIEKYWHMGIINRDKRFKYYDPTFEPSDEFIEAMIERANKMVKDPVARKYDWLQLALGYVVNFAIWMFCPWLWGREVVKWFNLPGGLEVCISGLVACLRWGEWKSSNRGSIGMPTDKVLRIIIKIVQRTTTKFFKGYDTAVIPPCLAPLSKNWIMNQEEK